MIKTIFFVALFACLGAFPISAQTSGESPDPYVYQNERIMCFHSIMQVQKDCSVKITERITVYAKGIDINHGIFRDLPLYYNYEGGRTDVGFTLNSVKLDGKPEDYHTEGMDNGIRIYAGSEDRLVSDGKHTYEFSYTVDHVLGLKDPKFDELYWNVNGNGWIFTIDTVRGEVHYPKDAKLVQFRAYTGRMGEMGLAFKADTLEDGVMFTSTRAFSAQEGMTIGVAWDKNHLTYPTSFDNFIYWVKSHFLWIVGLFGFIITLLYSYVTWLRYGRDPKPGVIMPQYEAPEGFSPADAAYLNNYGRRTTNMFTGQLVGLATKGRLTIDVQETGGMFSKKLYTIKRTDDSAWKKEPLLPSEEMLYKDLFSHGAIVHITQGSYNKNLQQAQLDLIAEIKENQGEKYILKRNNLKAKQYIFPILMLLVGIGGSFLFGGNIAILIVFFVVTVIMNIIFGLLFEQPTELGRRRMDELAGFKLYMEYSDRERIRLTNPPTMNFEHFEKNLPYAIALGVASEWKGQFDQAELETHMSGGHYWYTGALLMGMHSFDFGDLSSTISSASTPPSSSSGGSGGGGFSGGGGGGGGGGGW
ncbi:MAG: DUF2207 domain-containing protein [Fluviicola sp.]|nr:DUF2207 domain-containing protein [Fluviicola sp.]